MMMLLQKFNLALLEGAVPAIKGRSWFLAVWVGCCVCVGLSGALQAQGKTDLSPDDGAVVGFQSWRGFTNRFW